MADIFNEHDGVITVTCEGGQVESPDDLYSGNRVTKEGMYHVDCTGIKLVKADTDGEKKKLPMLEIELHVMAGTDADGKAMPEQVDKAITHRIYLANWDDKKAGTMKPLDEKKQKGLRAFAFAFGLVDEKDIAKANLQIPFHMMEGRQAIVKVSREKDWEDDEGKPQKGGLKISWNNDAWPVTHDYVKDVHKNREALSLLAGVGAATGDADADLSDV